MKKILTGIIGAMLLTITAVSPGVSAAHSPGPLDNIQLSPLTASVPTGTTQQFTAIARDSDNNLVPGVSFTWNVVAGGGTISNAGLFTAGNTTGNYTNTVQVIAVKGSVTSVTYATVKVIPVKPLDHVVISPSSTSVPAGATQQFTAIARDSDNNSVPGVTFTWNVVAGGGTISNTGLFTAGNTTGNYTNTVQVIAVKGSVTKVAYATVKILEDDQKSLDRPHGWSQGKKTGWQNGDTPPGWSHGKKTGWNAKSTPPGLAKKNGIK